MPLTDRDEHSGARVGPVPLPPAWGQHIAHGLAGGLEAPLWPGIGPTGRDTADGSNLVRSVVYMAVSPAARRDRGRSRRGRRRRDFGTIPHVPRRASADKSKQRQLPCAGAGVGRWGCGRGTGLPRTEPSVVQGEPDATRRHSRRLSS